VVQVAAAAAADDVNEDNRLISNTFRRVRMIGDNVRLLFHVKLRFSFQQQQQQLIVFNLKLYYHAVVCLIASSSQHELGDEDVLLVHLLGDANTR